MKKPTPSAKNHLQSPFSVQHLIEKNRIINDIAVAVLLIVCILLIK